MLRRLLLAIGLSALIVPALAANIPLFTGPAGTNPLNDPPIVGSANQIVNAVNASVTPASMATPFDFRNLLDNPKFDFQPISSGSAYTASTVTGTLTGINSTCTYLSGRWCIYANNGAASAQTAWVGLPGAGFQSGQQFGRTSGNANLTQICLVQKVPLERVIELQGQPLILSWYGLLGANFSGALNQVQAYVLTGTIPGVDQTIATLITSAPTTINGFSGPANQVNGALVTMSTTFTRYQINAGVVPTNATNLAVELCYTPTGTAGTADNVQVTGVQLEGGFSGSAAVGAATTTASTFEFRPQWWDIQQTARYAQFFTDGATTRRYAIGQANATTTVQFVLDLPTPMNTPPVTVFENGAIFAATNAGGTGFGCALTAIATSNTPNTLGLLCTSTAAFVAGNSSQLLGLNTGSGFLANSEY